MNEFIFIISMFFFLGCVLGVYKFFGKTGLFMFIVFATILANIQVVKTIELFGFTTTAGSVMYASTFLCTDILSEKYGKNIAKKSVYIGITITILWLIGTQITLLFNPSDSDFTNDSLSIILGLVPRISIASLLAYGVSQSVDVFLYHKIWNRTNKLWVRNNGSTMISQLIDTLIFISIAFIGTVEFSIVIQIFISTYFFKILVAFIDTPFIYFSKKITCLDFDEKEKCLK